MNSSFRFLQSNYTKLYALCELSEKLIDIDASSSFTKSRLFAEKVVQLLWVFEELEKTEDAQVKKIDKLYSEAIIPCVIRELLHTICKSGNRATNVGDVLGPKHCLSSRKHFVWPNGFMKPTKR